MAFKYFSFIEPHFKLFGTTEGLEQSDIVDIEKSFKINLPDTYKEFLHFFGKKSGNLLSSYLMEVHKLKGNRESAVYASVDELDNKRSVDIKDSYFFFGQWQGYVFYFFDCTEESENPAVYILTDSPKIEKYKNSFTEFIYDEGIKPLLDLQSPQI